MAHTPGPWRFQQDGGEPYWSVDMPRPGGEEYGSANAMVYTNEADARLIAAAPELLAALYRVIAECNCALDYVGVDDAHTLQRVLNRFGKARKVCEDAISKAEGRE